MLLVPTVLLLVTLKTSDYTPMTCIVHVPVWFILIVGKFPGMEGVRLFGINRTPGVDDDEYTYDVTPAKKGM